MYNVRLTESFFPAQTDTPFNPRTIGDMLRQSAEKWPDQYALTELDFDGSIGRRWTYKKLLDESLRLAGALVARHKQGARVAIWAPNIPEWVLLEYGLAFAGVTLVTVNPSYQPRELEYVLKQSGSEALYYVDEFRGNPMSKIANEVCDRLPQIKHRIVMTDHDAVFGGPTADLPIVNPDDEVQIQYTSGTTGFPKGALLHHQGLVQNGYDILNKGGFEAGDKTINFMPMFHTTGCAGITLGTMSAGGEMLLAPMFDPVVISEVITREKIAFLFGVPTMLVALIEMAKAGKGDYSSVRAVSSGGAMVPPELAKASEKYFGSLIQIVYGQTEASPGITTVPAGSSFTDATETIGQAYPHVDVSIRDPQTNNVMPLNEQGEICSRGYNTMIGYNDNPDATAAAIDNEGWLHTGDLGSMDERGFVKITGRVKEMIIRGGENMFPAEIENAMLEHDAVAEVAVAGIPDEKWGEQIACFMRCGDREKPNPASLKSFIRDRLSPQKTPTYWVWVDNWPLTGSGKIQKFKLVEAFEKDEFDVQTV